LRDVEGWTVRAGFLRAMRVLGRELNGLVLGVGQHQRIARWTVFPSYNKRTCVLVLKVLKTYGTEGLPKREGYLVQRRVIIVGRKGQGQRRSRFAAGFFFQRGIRWRRCDQRVGYLGQRSRLLGLHDVSLAFRREPNPILLETAIEMDGAEIARQGACCRDR